VPLTFSNSKIEVDGVLSIVVSPISPDTATTAYARLIQIYDQDVTVVNRRPVLELYVLGGDQTVNNNAPLEIAIPGGILF
jgi:hypothetical protein